MTRIADTIIKGGTVVDGSGGEPYPADIAILDGRIAAVGERLDRLLQRVGRDVVEL